MNKLKYLLKINLLAFVTNNKQKNLAKLLGVIAIAGLLGFTVYTYAERLMDGLLLINQPIMLLGLFIAVVSSFIIFTNFYRITGIIYEAKDFDLLLSLPITKTVIIISKIINLYFYNLMITFVIMIPALICYAVNVSASVMTITLTAIMFFFIPIIPIIVATIIGSFITNISSFVNNKKILNYIFTIGFLAIFMYLNFKFEKISVEQLADISTYFVKTFNHIYPLTGLYMDIIKNTDWLAFLFSINITLLAGTIFTYLISLTFYQVVNKLKNIRIHQSYRYRQQKKASKIIAIYQKEIKRYFSSVNYVMNTAIGIVLLTLISISILIGGAGTVKNFIETGNTDQLLGSSLPLFISLFVGLSCTTFPSISLEGNNLWILKNLPLTSWEIYIAKMLVNLTITIPLLIINLIILNFGLYISIRTNILCLIIPGLYALLIPQIGLINNLIWPNFAWKNEIRVIKQSIPSLITVFIGIGLTIVPLAADIPLPQKYLFAIIIVSLIVLNIVATITLKTWGKKRWQVI